jgi:hypothetical protein
MNLIKSFASFFKTVWSRESVVLSRSGNVPTVHRRASKAGRVDGDRHILRYQRADRLLRGRAVDV